MLCSDSKITTFELIFDKKMNNIGVIQQYFENLSDLQIEQFSKLGGLYQDWNLKINVVSRKDVEFLYQKHVLHSLAIAKFMPFKAGAEVLDLGTGGGFPGIPLAILFPETSFMLVDSIGKKIKVVEEVVKGLDLKNVQFRQIRVEQLEQKFDFVVSRAVAPLRTLIHWTKGKYLDMWNHDFKNGLICLKGGDLTEEIKEANKKEVKVVNVSEYFEGEFFETKKVVYVNMMKKKKISKI